MTISVALARTASSSVWVRAKPPVPRIRRERRVRPPMVRTSSAQSGRRGSIVILLARRRALPRARRRAIRWSSHSPRGTTTDSTATASPRSRCGRSRMSSTWVTVEPPAMSARASPLTKMLIASPSQIDPG